MVKHLPTMRETWVQSLGREDLLEKETATHSSILTWKIPWTEEPRRLQSTGSQRVGHDWATSLFFLMMGNQCKRCRNSIIRQKRSMEWTNHVVNQLIYSWISESWFSYDYLQKSTEKLLNHVNLKNYQKDLVTIVLNFIIYSITSKNSRMNIPTSAMDSTSPTFLN